MASLAVSQLGETTASTAWAENEPSPNTSSGNSRHRRDRSSHYLKPRKMATFEEAIQEAAKSKQAEAAKKLEEGDVDLSRQRPTASSICARLRWRRPDKVSPQEASLGRGSPQFPVSVFVSVDDLKMSVREKLTKRGYQVQDFYKKEGCAQAMARSMYFEQVTLSVIALNALWIMVDTDFNSSSVLSEAEVHFQVADHLFCGFFFLEWIVRLLAFSLWSSAVRDAWFMFDTLLLALMVGETWIMTIFLSASGRVGADIGDASILRLLRLFRLARMTRVAKLLRALPELVILLKGLAAAFRTVGFTLLLLLLVLYIFGIAFSQLTLGTAIKDTKFRTVPDAMLTLFLQGALMDDITELFDEMRKESAAGCVMMIVFVLVAAITLMNMLIGVLCEVVSLTGQVEREEMLVRMVKDQLQGIVEGADTDGDGMISHNEFLSILENPAGVQALSSVGVDPVGLIDFADTIFEDSADEKMQIPFGTFMGEVLQLRGQNTATVKDLVGLRKYISNQNQDIHGHLRHVTARLERLSLEVGAAKKNAGLEPSGERQERALEGATAAQKLSSLDHHRNDLDPVLLHAHMASPTHSRGVSIAKPQAKPENVWEAKAVANARKIEQRYGAGASRSHQVAPEQQLPDKLDASALSTALSQKLTEMQELLDSLVLGEIAAHGAGGAHCSDKPKTPVQQQPQGEGGDAAGGKPRVFPVAAKAVANSASPQIQDKDWGGRTATTGGQQDVMHEHRGRPVRRAAPEDMRWPIEDLEEEEC